jgi:hypothetical protein
MVKGITIFIPQNESDLTSKMEVIAGIKRIITTKVKVIYARFLKLLTSRMKDLSIFSHSICDFINAFLNTAVVSSNEKTRSAKIESAQSTLPVPHTSLKKQKTASPKSASFFPCEWAGEAGQPKGRSERFRIHNCKATEIA